MSTHAPKVLMWKNVQKSCHFKHPLTDCFCVGRPIYKQGFSCFSKRGYVSSNGYSNSKPVSKMSSSSSQRIIVPPDIRNEAYTKRCLRSRHLNYHLSIGYQQIHSASGKTRGISRQSEIKWWTESTEKLLDSSTISIGSWDSLIWHKAETMIAYWSENGSSGLETSWRVLDRMMEEARGNHDHSFKMDIYLLHAVLLNWKKNFVKSGKRDLLPSKVLTKIDRYCAEAPFCLEPNVATYTIILDGAASCPDPAERVIFTDVLLHRLIEESGRNPALRPTAVTFGMVMKAWSKSGNLDLAKKSEGLLRQALELKNNQPGWEDLEINSLTYTSVLWAYANAGAPKPAQQLLLEMYQEYLVNDNLAVKPNVQAFNTVLTAWSRSSAPDAFANAEDLLFKMNELYRSGALDSPPNSASYNCVLNALARNPDIVENPVDKAEKLLKDQICMLKTDQQSRDQNKALLMTFTAMLRILATSNHADKDRQVELWLKKAKELGVEDDRFLLDQYETFLLKKKGETSTKKDGKIKNPL